MARNFLLRDRRAQRRDPGDSPESHGYAPGGDPLHPLRGFTPRLGGADSHPGPRGTAGPRREGLM